MNRIHLLLSVQSLVAILVSVNRLGHVDAWVCSTQ